MTAYANNRCTVLCVCAAAAGLAACGSGGGSADDGSENTGGGGGGGNSMLEPSFDSIQSNVFSIQCQTCHTGATAPLGLRLDAANSYGLLVGVASQQAPSLLRVDPGDPDASYLIRKLEGTATTGGRMPLDLPALPDADIAVIRQWITEGAMGPSSGTPPQDPIRVSSMSPLPGTSQASLPMTVMVMFDRELDATTVDATTFVIERSGGDGTFGDGNEVAVTPDSVSVPMSNTSAAVANLGSVPSIDDSYRITVEGSGAAVIQDLDGNALDGEFSGSFPSGNGSAGGDFVASFDVTGVQPTLTSIQSNVFTPVCSGCHTGTTTTLPGSMNLGSAADSFANLVGAVSVQEPSLDRVEPGDPDASYIVRKIEGTAATGQQMPPFGTPLDSATIAAIRQWIADGASMQ